MTKERILRDLVEAWSKAKREGNEEEIKKTERDLLKFNYNELDYFLGRED